jgi:hypothetical protein
MLFGLESERCARFFAELLLNEMVQMFNTWNKYSAVPVEELKQAGHQIFKRANLAKYLQPNVSQ